MMRARGQGLVEVTLLMIVLVSLVVLGMHLGEVSEVSLKAPMLSHAALFDAQGHDVRRGIGPTQATVSAQLLREGADLDLRTSASGPTYRGVFASVPRLSGVSTSAFARIDRPTTCSYPPNDPFATVPASLDTGFSIEASTRLEVTSLRVPTHFGDGANGLFGEGLIARTNYPICALGHPVGAGCSGTFKLILDDHAEHDEGPLGSWDQLDCGLMGCANTNDKERSQAHFTPGNGSASNLSRAVLGTSPANEDEFWMSFRDASAGFTENGFKTGPGPASRANVYLGVVGQ
jgi:hypothetical protein